MHIITSSRNTSIKSSHWFKYLPLKKGKVLWTLISEHNKVLEFQIVMGLIKLADCNCKFKKIGQSFKFQQLILIVVVGDICLLQQFEKQNRLQEI
jgi:hypothetical protein